MPQYMISVLAHGNEPGSSEEMAAIDVFNHQRAFLVEEDAMYLIRKQRSSR